MKRTLAPGWRAGGKTERGALAVIHIRDNGVLKKKIVTVQTGRRGQSQGVFRRQEQQVSMDDIWRMALKLLAGALR